MAALSIASVGSDNDGDQKDKNKKPEDWAGPMNKSELTKAARDLSRSIAGAESVEDLRKVQENFLGVINQLQKDLPTWWDGDGEDIKGARLTIAERHADLEKLNKPAKDIL